MGADATTQQLEKTTVLINLVPQGVKFDDTTALLIYKKFWQREILSDSSTFGSYEVLYVHYPGYTLTIFFKTILCLYYMKSINVVYLISFILF